MSYRPVFIGGCDRSGTTLLGDLLGAADTAFATPESQFLHDLVQMCDAAAFSGPVEAADWLLGHFRYATWDLGLGREALAARIDLADPARTISGLLDAYQRRHRPDRPRCTTWIDHTPDNFRHYLLLKRVFPAARFVHIVRDGRAVAHSIMALDWGPNNIYMATRHWAERLREAAAVVAAEQGACPTLRYEDLVQDPERTLRALSTTLGLAFDAAQVRGGGLALPRFTRAQHRLVGRRPDPRRAGAWRQGLGAHRIREFERYAWTRVYLRRHGYRLEHAEPGRTPALRALGYYLHEYASYLLHRWRHRRMETATLRHAASARV